MRRLAAILLVVTSLGLPNIALADYLSLFGFDTTGQQVNKVKLTNYETILKLDSSGALQLAGGTFTDVDPGINTATSGIKWNTFQTVSDDANGKLEAATPDGTYYAAQILRATSLNFVPEVGSDRPIPAGYQMTSYAVQKFGTRYRFTDPDGTQFNWIAYTATDLDPFNKFTAAEISNSIAAKVFFNSAETFTYDGDGGANAAAKLTNDVNNSMQGDLFVSLGYGPAQDGGATGTASLTSSPVFGNANATGGLNVLAWGSLFNGLVAPGVDNADDFGVGLGLTSFSIEASVRKNSAELPDYLGYPDGSPWRLKSEDPWAFRLVPEPTSLVAISSLGLMVCGLSVSRRWRRKNGA